MLLEDNDLSYYITIDNFLTEKLQHGIWISNNHSLVCHDKKAQTLNRKYDE